MTIDRTIVTATHSLRVEKKRTVLHDERITRALQSRYPRSKRLEVTGHDASGR